MSNNFDSIDPDFVKDLLESDKATFIVTQKLRLAGYTVTLPPISIRPDVGQIKEFGDSGDIWIGDKIIEVKQRPDLEYNNLESFPYPDVIVDVKHRYGRPVCKPLGQLRQDGLLGVAGAAPGCAEVNQDEPFLCGLLKLSGSVQPYGFHKKRVPLTDFSRPDESSRYDIPKCVPNITDVRRVNGIFHHKSLLILVII